MNWHKNLIKNGGQSLENRVEDYQKGMVLEEEDKKLTTEHFFRTLLFFLRQQCKIEKKINVMAV